jgi:beta-mannosidase
MVWQDFMFACAMYPGDDAFIANVSKEFDYQIPRIARHPSVVLFNGNNEVDVAWKNWGFQVRYLIGPSDSKMIKEAYDRLFKKVIPQRLTAARCHVPYIHTSPLSNWGKKDDFNHGSQHYWGVWHGSDPIEDFGKKSGRFNAEYGFQSFPQMSTIASFAEPDQWDLDSAVMKHHQKSYVGNKMIAKQSERLFGKTDDFKSFVYRSQLTQAEAVGLAVSSHRIQAPRCMGTLVWQLNDCWSAPTWSSVDYFGNWKALHYRMKKDYADVSVLQSYRELGKEQYHLSNMSGEFKKLQVKISVYNLFGEVMAENKEKISLAPLASLPIALVCQYPFFQNSNYVIHFEVFENDDLLQHRSFSHLPSYKTVDGSKREVVLTIHLDDGKQSGYVEVKSAFFLHHFYLTCSSSTMVLFEENYLEILPGKTRIKFKSKRPIEIADIHFDYL